MINDKEFRNRVLAATFLHPSVTIPFLIGIFSLFFSFEGPRYFRILAALGLFISCSFLIARTTIWFDGIVQKTFTRWNKRQERRRNQVLDQLDKNLAADSDPKDEQILRQLRSVYKVFVETVESGRIREYDFLNTAERLFVRSVENLQESQDKWRQAMELPISSRKLLLEERSCLIGEVESSVQSLSNALQEVQKLTHKKSDLVEIRKELDQRLELARRVEKRISELGSDGNLPRIGEGRS